MIKHVVSVAAACGVLHMLAARPEGAVLRVPSEYATINAALDASVPGDSVLVAPGVYDQYETRLVAGQFWISSVGFLKAGVTLVSSGGAEATTIRLDAASAEPIGLVSFGSAGTSEIVGFTFSGGAPGLVGIEFLHGGKVIVRGCVFRDLGTGLPDEGGLGSIRADVEVYGCRFENINGAGGSAIGQTSGTLLVEDSEFLNCRSGAIQLNYDSGFPHDTELTLRRCRFVGNEKTNGGGGGVNVGGYSSVLIEDCWFLDNYAVGGGGGVGMGGPSCTLRNSVFVGNSVHGGGAAVYASGSLVVIEGNTFVDSETTRPQVFAGAVTILGSGARTVVRNVSVNSIGDPAFYIESAANLTEGCNVFWSNPGGNTQGFTPSPTDLEADPLFCDPPTGDFRLSAGSPCLPGNGHPPCTEPIGALGEGCGTIAVTPETWGKIKGQYRGEGDGR